MSAFRRERVDFFFDIGVDGRYLSSARRGFGNGMLNLSDAWRWFLRRGARGARAESLDYSGLRGRLLFHQRDSTEKGRAYSRT
jgi:hypothetical protein